MNAQRLGRRSAACLQPAVTFTCGAYNFSKSGGSSLNSFDARRNRGGHVRRRPVASEKSSNRRHGFRCGLHEIVARRSVRVHVNEARGDDSIRVIDGGNTGGNLDGVTRPKFRNPLTIDQNYAIVNLFRWRVYRACQNGGQRHYACLPAVLLFPPVPRFRSEYARLSTAAVFSPSSSNRSASRGETPFHSTISATGRFPPDAWSVRFATARLTPAAFATIATPRSRSLSLFIRTLIIHPESTRPARTMLAVESMFRTSFCAVPAFIRVEPASTSGPTTASIVTLANFLNGAARLAVSPSVVAPNPRA